MALPNYGTVDDGDAYFQDILDNSDWFTSTAGKRLTALKEATQIIEALPFKGTKKVEGQTLQFPRSYQDDVPTNVEHATYEIAKRLLAGVDTEDLIGKNLKREKFGPVEREFQDFREENAFLYLGIPSYKAYRLLCPYLRTLDTRRHRV